MGMRLSGTVLRRQKRGMIVELSMNMDSVAAGSGELLQESVTDWIPSEGRISA
jgi:hypothetical protein